MSEAPERIAAVFWLAPTLSDSAPATPVVGEPAPEEAVAWKVSVPSPLITVCTVMAGAVTAPAMLAWTDCPATLIARAAPTPRFEPFDGLPLAVAEASRLLRVWTTSGLVVATEAPAAMVAVWAARSTFTAAAADTARSPLGAWPSGPKRSTAASRRTCRSSNNFEIRLLMPVPPDGAPLALEVPRAELVSPPLPSTVNEPLLVTFPSIVASSLSSPTSTPRAAPTATLDPAVSPRRRAGGLVPVQGAHQHLPRR